MSGMADAAVSLGSLVGSLVGIGSHEGGELDTSREQLISFTDLNGEDITDKVWKLSMLLMFL